MGEVPDQFPEVYPLLGGKEDRELVSVAARADLNHLHGELSLLSPLHAELPCLPLPLSRSLDPLQVLRGGQVHHRLQGLFALVARKVRSFPHDLPHLESGGILHHHLGPDVQRQPTCLTILLSLVLVEIDFNDHGQIPQAA